MDEQTKKEIQLLKTDIYNLKETVGDINALVKNDIDRDFRLDLWELSERELNNEMGSRLSLLNDDIDPTPESHAITSHRKIIGPLIVFFKKLIVKTSKIYIGAVLEKQRRFNEQLVGYHLATFIRFKQNETRIKSLEEKVKTVEEDRELMMEQLNRLQEQQDQQGLREQQEPQTRHPQKDA
ncbi:MAG: hypothetical protein GY757_42055 [bacterium]|nr:hypothetical protein [bacterium]